MHSSLVTACLRPNRQQSLNHPQAANPPSQTAKTRRCRASPCRKAKQSPAPSFLGHWRCDHSLRRRPRRAKWSDPSALRPPLPSPLRTPAHSPSNEACLPPGLTCRRRLHRSHLLNPSHPLQSKSPVAFGNTTTTSIIMKIRFVFHWCFCLAFAATSFQHVKSETNAKVEIIQPFQAWFLTENVDFFVRVANIGDKAIRVANTAQEDLFFEIAPKVTTLVGDVLNLPKVENAGRSEPKGLLLPPGRAYTLSDADYNEADLVNSECFTRVRVHLLIETGRWVSSEWTERKILPAPDLNAASLYDYKLSADSSSTHSVISLRAATAGWADRVGE